MSTTPYVHSGAGTGALHTLEAALGQSHEVKAKVEACAEELASANQLAKAQIARGATTLPASEVLQGSVSVERQVQEVAGDLQQVSANLEQSMDEVHRVERALSRSRKALSRSQAELATSIQAGRAASWRALHDDKTGLPNRTLFNDRLAQAITSAERQGGTLAVMFLDLDRFKTVNDQHGHAVGDTLLMTVAGRLLTQARDADTVCRSGGDEFLYLLINPDGRDNLRRIAALVRASIMQPIAHESLRLVVTPSIGIALFPDHAAHAELLIARADAAMYLAKQRGSAYEFFAEA